MATRSTGRLILALAYLAALLGGGWWIYAQAQRFEGRMHLRTGHAERLVARPGGQGFALGAAHRAIPAELLPWEDPVAAARHFGEDGLVDAAVMPGRLQLRSLEVLETRPPREVLEIHAPTGRTTHPVAAGAPVPDTDPPLRMTCPRPWSGLVRDPRGHPMAAVGLRGTEDGAWSDPLLAAPGVWMQAADTFALRFAWARDEAAARADLARGGPGAATARWGVRDGAAIHWIEGLAPGSGIGLADGSEVVLLRAGAAPGGGPAILLDHRRDGSATRHWVPPGGLPDTPYHYEDPARAALLVEIRAWREDRVLAAAWVDGVALEPVELDVGAPWRPDGADLALRVGQILAQAIPVPLVDPPVMALEVSGPEGGILLREGELATLGDLRLRYRRLPVPPRVRAAFAYLTPGRAAEEFTLEAGQTRRLGDWIVAIDPDHLDPQPSVVVLARRTLGGPDRLLGAALFAIGATGMVWMRFARLPWAGRRGRGSVAPPEAAEDGDTPPDQP